MANSFSLSVEAFASKAEKAAEQVIRKVALDLGTSLVEKSPVGDPTHWQGGAGSAPAGYVGGRFRGNWQHGFATPPTGKLNDIDRTGAVSLQRIEAGVLGSSAFGIHYLVNNLSYSTRLESGHSRQAPVGIVGVTVLEFNGFVERAAAGVR